MGSWGSFVQELSASLSRKDQRAKVGLYLQGLILEGRRKSMQSTSERLRVDFQQLQQLVSSSPWPGEPVRWWLASTAVGLIEPEAWVIHDTSFPKDPDGPKAAGTASELLRDPPRNPARGHRPTRPLTRATNALDQGITEQREIKR